MEFSITTTPLLGIFLGLGLSLITIISILKYRFFEQNKDARSKYYWQRKATKANVFAFNLTFFLCGMALALGIAVLALNWTILGTKGYNNSPIIYDWDDCHLICNTFPRIPPPPPPPAPPSRIEEVFYDIPIEEPVDFNDQTVEAETEIHAEPVFNTLPPPPPPLSPRADQGELVYKVVNQMPRFPGCEDIEGTEQDKKVCANKKLLDFIWKNLKWPSLAHDAGVQGTCVISFMINQEGMIENPRIVRDIGAGCGEEALRVVKLMNEKGIRWIPGVHRGRNVKVQYNLPIKFK